MTMARFVPYHQLVDVPHTVVDGSAQAGTVLTLSHWPGSPTPRPLWRDLSAEIAFALLDAVAEDPTSYPLTDAVTNNHFDEDGLIGLHALLAPERAQVQRDRLVDVARAGDFETWHDRDAARIALAIAAHADADRSPLDPAVFTGGWPDQTAALYEAMLPLVDELVDEPQRSRPLWAEQDARLQRGLEAIADGTIIIDEEPALDLSVVTIPEGWAQVEAGRAGVDLADAVPALALYRSLRGVRVLLRVGERYELRDRYESWVRYQSRRPARRVDLRPLAERLTAEEHRSARWQAGRPGDLTPGLTTVDGAPSSIPWRRVHQLVVDHLRTAPVAFDPEHPPR